MNCGNGKEGLFDVPSELYHDWAKRDAARKETADEIPLFVPSLRKIHFEELAFMLHFFLAMTPLLHVFEVIFVGVTLLLVNQELGIIYVTHFLYRP